MQWLINIIKEWIVAEGYLLTSFVDRGAAGSYDFIIGHFTRDGTWHELDISSIVPAGAKAVLLWVRVKNDDVGKGFNLRSHATPSSYNISNSTTQAADIRISSNPTIHLDSNRIIEYMAAIGGWSDILITVRGWWL